MHDDDKTIMIYPGGEPDTGTQVSNTFAEPTIFANNEVASPEMYETSSTFVHSYQSQAFLAALRAVYREVYRLETVSGQEDFRGLKRNLIQIMDQQTRSLAEAGYENTHIMIIRYVMSTFIDEYLGTMSSDSGESWANYSLLGHYYQETYGGEKFFQLLEQFMQEPGKYMQHMKLMYACLSLGYQGKYSLSEHSDVQIERIRQELFARIKNFDTEDEKFYNDHPVSSKKNKLTLHVPYKLFVVSALFIMVIVYGVFSSMISQNETDLMEILQQGPVLTQVKAPNVS